MNKTIYMTYKKHIPFVVIQRWKQLNPEYKIDFSLDTDCVDFLEKHINSEVAALFNRISIGMYKADLWRLCKLYVYGGVYADVDIVPHVPIDSLLTDATFYSSIAMDKKSIFQAFMIVTRPKHPLILQFLMSLIQTQPFDILNGPTKDMYTCLTQNIPVISPGITYPIHEIRIPKGDRQLWRPSEYLEDDIVIPCKESVYLFQETIDPGSHWSKCYVVDKGVRIMDSRDPNYYLNGGW
jgi:hypothetical protein